MALHERSEDIADCFNNMVALLEAGNFVKVASALRRLRECCIANTMALEELHTSTTKPEELIPIQDQAETSHSPAGDADVALPAEPAKVENANEHEVSTSRHELSAFDTTKLLAESVAGQFETLDFAKSLQELASGVQS